MLSNTKYILRAMFGLKWSWNMFIVTYFFGLNGQNALSLYNAQGWWLFDGKLANNGFLLSVEDCQDFKRDDDPKELD